MARPQKAGLEYFPLDVDIDQDDKIELIEAKLGIVGFGIVIKLFMKIYKEGYFYEWTEKEQLLFSRRINVDINLINDVINECIKWGLFDSKLFEKYHILTSNGIQKRYLEAVGRRIKVVFIREYCLIDTKHYSNIVYEYINPINVNNNPINDSNNPQSKVKESKEYNTIITTPAREENLESDQEPNPFIDDGFKKVINHFNNNVHPITPTEAERIKDWLNDVQPDVLIMAVDEAVMQGVRKMSYINQILVSWTSSGLKTKEAIEANKRDWQEKQSQQKGGKVVGINKQYSSDKSQIIQHGNAEVDLGKAFNSS